MKVHQTIIKLRGLLIALSLLFAFQSARAAGFNVTSVADSGPGSLREAITVANANPGLDTITFAFSPPVGLHTIVVQSALPVITDTVIIDGWSRAARGPAGAIELTGNSRVDVGLQFGSFPAGVGNGGADSLVRGLIINGFSTAGIQISTHGVTVIGCSIGLAANLTAPQPNGIGIWLSHATDCQIGRIGAHNRNVISGNTGAGVLAENGADNTIQGNYIGLTWAGLFGPVGNDIGVFISDLSGDLVGGTDPGERNVITNNWRAGIVVTQTFDNTRIEGNYIGTMPDGMTGVGGGGILGIGISLEGDYNTVIGGATPEAGNVISGNPGTGIDTNRSTGAVIENNLIGVGADRTKPVGNGGPGISSFGSSNTKIGGTVKLIKVIRPVPVGNIIAFNGRSGVELHALADLAIGGGNLISRNEIHDNVGLGIDIVSGSGGVNPNDECDADSGPNGIQNFPTISSVTSVNGTTTINGHMNSSANTPFRIEFFTNPSCDSSGNGEGAVYLASIMVSTPPHACDTAFTVTLNTALPPNTVITATATHPNGSTSEFSPCAFVSNGLPQ